MRAFMDSDCAGILFVYCNRAPSKAKLVYYSVVHPIAKELFIRTLCISVP
jgi:hypothetical protein